MKTATYPFCYLWKTTKKIFNQYKNQTKIALKKLSYSSTKLDNSACLPEDVFSVISHEIANSLTILLNTSALLNSPNNKNGAYNLYSAEMISQQVFRVQQTINSCRLFLLPQEDPFLEQCSLKDIVHEASALIKNTFLDIDFLFHYATEDSFECLGHPDLFLQVFINLFHNSIKHSSSDYRKIITISFNYDVNQISVLCADNGPGIYLEDPNLIFIKGISSSRSAADQGMGLFIVQRIMHTLNSVISLESSSSNGTVFKLSFPTYSNAPLT
ncbi:hypothetical protein CLAVI_000190 [Candidatus Clavichlamydia salmonicola]|uniref:sensor histidine kinase n=1 Tax=Candidatus Clavichlamydia salmonicola TaxID=469812 RepID=UPI00189195B4|nr:HAMP domain-containing sensor histidine kinase [Candidatus Clavichlamydia salmonicola]MBF5050579.1 hypothetical protein [Candidatus Clavichlamydia salmonicola]